MALATVVFILLFGLWGSATSEEDTSSLRAAAQRLGKYTDGLFPGSWRSPGTGGFGSANYTPVSATNQWVKGSGRPGLTYDTPFNPDDLTMTEDECDAAFPGLWKDIDRSVKYFTEVQK